LSCSRKTVRDIHLVTYHGPSPWQEGGQALNGYTLIELKHATTVHFQSYIMFQNCLCALYIED